MRDVLNEVYQSVYNEPFTYGELEKRMKMQKAVYLLENMGVYVGDYGFVWSKYGPYSLGLDSDAELCGNMLPRNVVFSKTAINAFKDIQSYIKQETSYPCDKWMECIASIHYLKNIFRIKEENLFDELVDRNPYLNDRAAFEHALEIVKKIEI